VQYYFAFYAALFTLSNKNVSSAPSDFPVILDGRFSSVQHCVLIISDTVFQMYGYEEIITVAVFEVNNGQILRTNIHV
jgi:hypothetical protein